MRLCPPAIKGLPFFIYFCFIFFGCFLFAPQTVAEPPSDDEVEAVADNLQYLENERKLVGTGNVVITYRDIELTADQAEVNVETKEAHATGHVVVRQLGKTLSGNEVFFDFKNNSGSFPDGRFFQFPWYGFGKQLEQVSKNKITARDVFITSCDLPHPHYDVKASQTDIYPGDKIVAKNVTFRILEVPVFWWPYLIIPLNQNAPFDITPGYSDEYGAFVLASKGFSVSKNVSGRLRFDWYSKRGFGYGADINYKFDRLGLGQVKLYGINDEEAPNQRADNPFSDKSEEYRGRVSWRHKTRIDPRTTLHLQWNELSDERFLQDFFEREHREEINPNSFLTITRSEDDYSLVTHVEKRANRFQTVAEKLPEVVFTWFRKPLFGTNFYYTHEDGFVNFNQTKAFSPDGPNTVQFYTDQELSYPLRFFRFYNFVPFANFRDDFFSKSREKEDGTNRFVGGGGFDASTRFYNRWDYSGKFLGIEINQLRHVFEPIIQYNSIRVASVHPAKLVVTGRGDQLDHQDILTLGVENRIQTKRRVGGAESARRVDLVSFNAFLDYSFGPGSELLRTRANKFTDARLQTILRPYDWFALRNDTVYDLLDHQVFTNNLDLAFDPGRLHLTLSHRYTNDRPKDGRIVDNLVVERPHLSLDDAASSNQITVDAVYDLNKRWDIGGYVRWKIDDNLLEEWEIRAQRDLHDWLLDFGFNVRNSDRTDAEKELNKEVFVQLRLKALPEIELKTGHRASFAESRIGRTVAGSNEAPPPPSFLVSPDAQYASLSTT
ncbi:MAG: LPS-assembly protein LptD [Candidatus Omnitrophica bacterium]|nr:LPS-assembly protein LptD [Candidatus Omnitrophota bacterium]